MAEKTTGLITRPRGYLWQMSAFLIITGSVVAVLGYPSDQLRMFFNANPGLNGLIAGVLLIGILYAYGRIFSLWPAAIWLESLEGKGERRKSPRLLAPLSALMEGREGVGSLESEAARSAADSIGARLAEQRDLLRYMVGLLVFLGLLGTFWGLLQTVSSIGGLIGSLDVNTEETATLLSDLIGGLEAPLGGMGTAFSSSLFGLGGSLILGFLELQVSGAQNRFHDELEEWILTKGSEGDRLTGLMGRLDALIEVLSAKAKRGK